MTLTESERQRFAEMDCQDAALDAVTQERDALRAEVERLRKHAQESEATRHAAAERVVRRALDEIARLRAILATALVPCPECGGQPEYVNEHGRECLCCRCGSSPTPGWVPWREP